MDIFNTLIIFSVIYEEIFFSKMWTWGGSNPRLDYAIVVCYHYTTGPFLRYAQGCGEPSRTIKIKAQKSKVKTIA